VSATWPSIGRAQSFFDRLNFDKLQIASLGGAVGRIQPSQVEPTSLIAIQADYGEVAPQWRIVVSGSYWSSRFRAGVVQAFVDSLNKSLADPTGQAAVKPSPITLYDVTFSGEARFTPKYSGDIKPFIGVGFAAHVINAEGSLIDGTFVERSLDDIAAGLFLTGGASLRIVNHFGINGMVRADLLSGFRSTQVLAGATYYFGHVRGTTTAGSSGAR
jgi:hypothetical protein